jgi:RimJ/RimL family protein N-acetyltransferase
MIELRIIGPEYVKQIYEIYKDREVFDKLGAPFDFENVTVEFEREFLENLQKEIKEKKAFAKGIFFNNKLVGFIGTKKIYANESEFGYWLGRKYWGQGIVSEAIRIFVKDFFENFKIEKLVAGAYKNNIASQRVLEKNGFKKFKEEKVFDKFKKKEVEEIWFELKK